jgi:hypothetical protein
MDKKTRLIVSIGGGAIFIISLVAYLVFAQGVPEDACKFYGSLKIDGANAPLETTIVAYINGNPVRTEGGMIGEGWYRVYVYEGSDGDTVTFKVNGYDATPTGTWQRRGDIWLPLTVDTGGGPSGECELGEDCTNCEDWVTEGSEQVRDSDNNGKYDQACCGGTIRETSIF